MAIRFSVSGPFFPSSRGGGYGAESSTGRLWLPTYGCSLWTLAEPSWRKLAVRLYNQIWEDDLLGPLWRAGLVFLLGLPAAFLTTLLIAWRER